MKNTAEALTAWGAVALAAALWIGVAYFALSISVLRDAGVSEMNEEEAASARQQAFIRLHALARDTKSARDALEGLTAVDLLDIASVIEEVGNIAGAPVKIASVIPLSPAQSQNAQGPAINEADFIVETEGSFQTLMHASALFGALPVLSGIQSLEFERGAVSSGTGNKQGLWRLTARIRVLTTRNI